MKTITFFSYKGGNGRTLTAANFAVYLTKLGLKVVIMDFDLDAPGVDSKFPEFNLPKGQLGLIDYILEFQRSGSPPGPVGNIHCSIAIKSPRHECSLGLIPAGDYLGADYPGKLNELSWEAIFSPQRNGVAFFQMFLQRIERELNPDVLVIDSRTGFSEIGGLCTQQLADETVILSSLAKESIKMTRHLAHAIRDSEISRKLNKAVETKVVVCRVPKPKDIDKLKSSCCRLFEVDERNLFFLFSCRGLEQDEFVAMMDTRKEEELTASYVRLFQGLNVEVARKSIRAEIARTELGLLSCSAEEAEGRIREMVALYPDAEVYRRAMRFFDLRQKTEDAVLMALRVLDLEPVDQDAQLQVSRFVLDKGTSGLLQLPHFNRALAEITDRQRLIFICEQAYAARRLSVADAVKLADILEDLSEFAKSFQISIECLRSGAIDDAELRDKAKAIAARTAMRLGKVDEASALVKELPAERLLHGPLGRLAFKIKIEAGKKSEALELAKTILLRRLDGPLIAMANDLSKELGEPEGIIELLRNHPGLEEEISRNPELSVQLGRMGLDLSNMLERQRKSRRLHRSE